MQPSAGRHSAPRSLRLRRRAAVLAATPGLPAAALLALIAVPGLVVLARLALGGGPLAGLALLVPGALLVGAERASRPTRGPAIHDRQLDAIVAALGGVAALAVAASAADPADALLVLAAGLVAVGVVALVGGTRRLWQLRAAPLLLVLAWPTPWAGAARTVDAALGAGTAALAVPALVVALVGALLLAPRLRRGAVLPRGVEVPVLAPLPVPRPVVVELRERVDAERVAS